MSFQAPITIAQAIDNIENHRYLLPSIQRDFVWSHTKIEWLFDSIMRDYPISSFLFWRVEGETKDKFKFYSFLKEYRQYFKIYNDEFNTSGVNDFTAILDGQQRLTSLYIGLKGSYAYKKDRVRVVNTEKNIPTRYLYLNITKPLDENEEGRIYNFKFLTPEDVDKQPKTWFKVGDILNIKGLPALNKAISKYDIADNDFAIETLSLLMEKIHLTPSINFFLEKDQDIDKALNIFIRINSGGEPLSFSDLLMSIAIANWTQKNARTEINMLVEELRDKGFFINKDFILKTFLYLHSKDIRFKVTNFSADNAKDFETRWDDIKGAILEVFSLVRSYGYVDSTLTSKNALLPIIYYLYHKNITPSFTLRKCYEEDRKIIRNWLNIALVKRIFGGQGDNILNSIRKVFTNDISKSYIDNNLQLFPKDEIMLTLKGTTKNMEIDDDYLDVLLTTQKDDNLAFSILALLYPNLDFKNGNFHKDHLHPYSHFNENTLKQRGIPQEEFEIYLNKDNFNSILNLQLLDANENESKQDVELEEWVKNEAQKQQISIDKFCENHILPNELGFKEFVSFIEKRKAMLKQKLTNI